MAFPVRRVLRSFGYAAEGLEFVARTQPNFLVHLVLAVVAAVLAIWLNLSAVEFAILALTIGVVLAAEALNSAVEAACDAVSADYHPLIKRAKDTAAAGVLITALAAILVALALFLPHLARRLGPG